MRLLFLLPLFLVVNGEEEPAPGMLMAQRFMQSLPEIPNVIQDGMEGKGGSGLKNMLSTVLGEGLISQLVVNPLGVAEDMGLPVDQMVNKTEMAKIDKLTGGVASQFLEKNNKTGSSGLGQLLNPLLGGGSSSSPLIPTPAPTTTTTEAMLFVDGVAVSDLDDFARKHQHLVDREGRPYLTTRRPPTTTSPPPSPEKTAERMAEAMVSALRKSLGGSEPSPPAPPPRRVEADASSFDLGLVDPRRIPEVSSLLRRAPQRFDTLSAPSAPSGGPIQAPGDFFPTYAEAAPPSFRQESPSSQAPLGILDQPIDDVVGILRNRAAGGGITVNEVKKLQAVLQNYEQTLQTKELFQKRRQLQVLQNELVEQKKKIEEQRKMEAELRKKEVELEQARLRMEDQLKNQLNQWHSSFHPPGTESGDSSISLSSLESAHMPGYGSGLPDSALAGPAHISPFPAFSISSNEKTEADEEITVEDDSLSGLSGKAVFGGGGRRPAVIEEPPMPTRRTLPTTTTTTPAPAPAPAVRQRSPIMHSLRYTPVHSKAEEIEPETAPEEEKVEEDDNDFSSQCECMKVDMSALVGEWVQVLAAPAVVSKTHSVIADMLGNRQPLNCSSVTISRPRKSSAAQESDVLWKFRVGGFRRNVEVKGTTLSFDHRTVRMQMQHKDDKFNIPFCILKGAGASKRYEYIVAVNAGGPCNEASLFVRNPDTFFDKTNVELVKYLKHMTRSGKLDNMEMVPHAQKC